MVVELPYTLHTRKKSIALAWSVILIPPVFLNIGLFYGLWYGTNLDRDLVLALPTGILGIFTIIATIDRVYKLWQPSPKYRPLNSGRWSFDVFMFGYFFVLIVISATISRTLATSNRHDPDRTNEKRRLSLPTSTLMVLVAVLTFLSLILNWVGWKVPFRFGSSPKGTVLRPAIFYIVEDIVAVDGGGGIEYREAINARYDSSPVFRHMIRTLSVVWMLWFFVLSCAFTVMIQILPDAAAYAVGWAGPFPLVGLLVVWTVKYVQARLKEERKLEGLAREEASPVDERTSLLNGAV